MTASRPHLLLGLALAFGCGSETPVAEPKPDAENAAPVRLIAHRGGVVGGEYAENSAAALEAAANRGYWMIEVDIRESKDGVAVVHHDPDFEDFYGDPRLLEEMTWEQIAELRATPGGSRPLTFNELAERAGGRLRLMLDVKPPEHSEKFFASLDEALTEHGLLETAYVIGTPQSREHFLGRAKVGVDIEDLRRAVESGEDVADRYFLFTHGRELDAEAVRYAQMHGVAVVPSINIFHYDDLPDHAAAAESDVRRMLELGVSELQIDSPYDVWLR